MNLADEQLCRSESQLVNRGSMRENNPRIPDTPRGINPTRFDDDIESNRRMTRSWRRDCWNFKQYLLIIVFIASVIVVINYRHYLSNSSFPGGKIPYQLLHPPAPPGCHPDEAALRVFMYDLEPEFHYGMLSEEPFDPWPGEHKIPAYYEGLYQQHSLEYWLTTDLLTSKWNDRRSNCTAYRVDDWKSADVIFVPFFASLSYNKYTRNKETFKREINEDLQGKLLKFLEGHPAWLANGGVDHVFVIHHPNSMHAIRNKLHNAMFVVADFGRLDPSVANITKDIVAPYMHMVDGLPDSATTDHFESRKTLLYFQGTIVRKEGGIIRQQLYELMKDEPGVHFEAGNTSIAAFQSATDGMQNSKFCLNLAGDTPSSNRLFDSIVSHCVPVIISDEIEMPFEDFLDYTTFCLFVKASDSLKPHFLINLLRGTSKENWTKMWKRLQEVAHHFQFQHPTKPDDAVHMTWKAIERKLPAVKLQIHRQRRFKMWDMFQVLYDHEGM